MDQHRHEHSHRDTDNDSVVLFGAAAVQEETRNKRPDLDRNPGLYFRTETITRLHFRLTFTHFNCRPASERPRVYIQQNVVRRRVIIYCNYYCRYYNAVEYVCPSRFPR